MKRIFTMLFTFALVSLSAVELPEERGPVLTTAAIIEVYQEKGFEGIVLIQRGKEPFGIALPGGNVEYGESVEDAVRREMQEEVSLELMNLRQFHVYSSPMRDPRFHSVEVTFTATTSELPKAGDDAAEAFLVKLDDIPWDKLTFDHAEILRDYLKTRVRGGVGSLNPMGRPFRG